jgi:hypothetical protein
MQKDRKTKGTGDERLLFKNLDEAAACRNTGRVQREPSLSTGTTTHDFWAEPYTAFNRIESQTHRSEPGTDCDREGFRMK